jgi:hypothetical protein
MIIGTTYNLSTNVYDYPVIFNNKSISRTSSLECLGILLDVIYGMNILKKYFKSRKAKEAQSIYFFKMNI